MAVTYPRLMPAEPRLFETRVLRTTRLSPSFQRITIGGADLVDFAWSGLDHWFRLFLPPAPGAGLELPTVEGRTWWQPYLAIPEGRRPHCANYTVADMRRIGDVAEMDIDVVLHWDAEGALCGGVAIWAATAEPGSPVGLLDQGPLFDPPADARRMHLVSDESGLPAVRGILRDLDADVVGTVTLEVPSPGDVERLVAPDGFDIRWLTRDAHAVPGAAALEAARSIVPNPADFAFVVGESALATGARRALHRAGLPKDRIFFSGFWKHSPVAERIAA